MHSLSLSVYLFQPPVNHRPIQMKIMKRVREKKWPKKHTQWNGIRKYRHVNGKVNKKNVHPQTPTHVIISALTTLTASEFHNNINSKIDRERERRGERGAGGPCPIFRHKCVLKRTFVWMLTQCNIVFVFKMHFKLKLWMYVHCTHHSTVAP